MEKKFVMDRVLSVLLGVAVLFMLVNVMLVQSSAVKISEAQEAAKEQIRPAELTLTRIETSSCSSCSPIEDSITSLKSLNVNVTEQDSVDAESVEGKELISKYNIQKLPSYIVSGELGKTKQLESFFNGNGKILEQNFIYTVGKPPYYDVSLKKTVGLVTMFNITDSDCSECRSLDSVSQALDSQGVFLQENKEVDYQSSEGKDLITQYGITQVPAVLISKDIDFYPQMLEQLQSAGVSEKSGFYALHSIVPPYREIATGSIVGLVDLVLLTDSSCTECYNVAVNKQILQRFGVVVKNETSYDVSSQEGSEFVKKYAIEKAPIILLSPQASSYSSLAQVWLSVGSIEEDGWLVMRNPEQIGAYKNLDTGQVITPSRES